MTITQMLTHYKKLDMLAASKLMKLKSPFHRIELRETRSGLETLTSLFESLLAR